MNVVFIVFKVDLMSRRSKASVMEYEALFDCCCVVGFMALSSSALLTFEV